MRSDKHVEILSEFKNFKEKSEDLDLLKTWMSKFIQSDEIAQVIFHALSAVNEGVAPAVGKAFAEKFELASNASYTLNLRVSPPGPLLGGFPTTAERVRLAAVVGNTQGAALQLYRLPHGTRLDVYDSEADVIDVRINSDLSSPVLINEGDIAILKGTQDMLILMAEAKKAVPTQWVFSDDLKPLHIRASSSSRYRNLTVIDLLERFKDQKLENDKVIFALQSMTHHPLHFVRWRAVQGLAKVDKHAAHHALQRLKNDTHPHVANAAQKALLQLNRE